MEFVREGERGRKCFTGTKKMTIEKVPPQYRLALEHLSFFKRFVLGLVERLGGEKEMARDWFENK